MKNSRIWILSVFILFVFTTLYGQNITVTQPAGGMNWCRGKPYTIQWNSSGKMSNRVKIRLFNAAGTAKIMNIANDTANNGNYNWTIPGSVSPGSYTIMVKTQDNQVWGLSNVFSIQNCVTANITVNQPPSGVTWQTGKKYNIQWSQAGSMINQVKIRLFDAGGQNQVLKIKNSCPNNGSYQWTIPAGVQNGQYRIRVKTLDNKVYGDSGVFSIQGGSNQVLQMEPVDNLPLRPSLDQTRFMRKPEIHVGTPKAGEVLSLKKPYKIIWSTTGVMFARVRIHAVYPKQGYQYDISYDTANDGEHIWPIHTFSWKPGKYKIRIQTLDDKVTGWSGEFTIPPKAPANKCNTGNPALDLECLINNYRKANGLKPVPHSSSMAQVALAHVKDLAQYHPENQCGNNFHSWSKNGPWKGGCYNSSDSSTYKIMWLKPKEIAGDPSYGFEIACKGCTTAVGSLNQWKGSSAHNAVILNQGMWKPYNWTGMGAAIYGGYAVVWFK